MSQKDVKDTFTIRVNSIEFMSTDALEPAVSAALGLHKMSNFPHKIEVSSVLLGKFLYLSA